MAASGWRRRAFSQALLTSAWLPGMVLAKNSALPVPASLPAVAEAATRLSEPLVLLVTLLSCPYCELVRRSYLLPARRDAGLQAWQLDVGNRETPLLGFDYQATTATLQASVWKASFTPTVLFWGRKTRRWQNVWWVWQYRIFTALIWKTG